MTEVTDAKIKNEQSDKKKIGKVSPEKIEVAGKESKDSIEKKK